MSLFFPEFPIDQAGPVVPPWYTRGWTSQNNAYLPSPPDPFSFSQFPPGNTFSTLQQNYFDGDSNPLGGYLTFWPSEPFTISQDDSTWRIPQRLLGTITWPGVDAGVSPWAFSQEGSGKIFIYFGLLIVRLYNTDNANLTTDSGDPLTYHVIEHFQGGRQFDITVPSDIDWGTKIYSLVVDGSMKPYHYDPVSGLGDVTGDFS